MPGRSPHRHSSPTSLIISSRRSPVSRGRMRSPDRRRPADSSRPRRTEEFRSGTVRSRSPVKTRSVSPPVKRNPSPKRSRENSGRPSTSTRQLLRSKSPITSPHLPEYKKRPKRSGSTERSRSGSYEREKVQFRGPEASIAFDVNELKKIAVDIIRRNRGPPDESSHINRAITNPEEITIVRRPDEGSRPIFMRPELMADNSKNQPPDEYRRIVAIDTVPSSDRERSERDKEHPHGSTRYSPARYEERSRPYYSSESRERARSPGYSSSRRSPSRTEFYESRVKVREERLGSSRDDLHKHDDARYSVRHTSCERERERLNEKRIESHHRHEDRHYERDRRRSEHLSPLPRKRRGSIDTARPSRPDSWEREHERERRKRAHSRSREREERMRSRERHEEFDVIVERPRRLPYHPDQRGYFKEEAEFIPIPVPFRGRGVPMPMIRRGLPVFRGRPMIRGPPRIFRGVPFIRGMPPRGPFMGMRGGFVPRFYPPF